VIGFPAIQALGSKSTLVGNIAGATSNADHPTLLDSDIEAATIGAENTSRLNPTLGLFTDPVINSRWPMALSPVWVSLAPDIFDTVAAFRHDASGLRSNATTKESLPKLSLDCAFA